MSAPIIRLIDEMDELAAVERLQRDVWGLDDLDIVPAAQLKASIHAGGHLIGAFRGSHLVGFAYAIVATAHGRGMSGVGLHSHMVAVSQSERGAGVGRSLKWFQRRLALEQGLPWITWTFDPLQAKNAKLNLKHLAAECHDYLVDFYGAMPGPLGGGQASDRLLALWLLDSPQVRELAAVRSPKVDGSREGGKAKQSTPDHIDRDDVRTIAKQEAQTTAEDAEATWLLSTADILAHRSLGQDHLRHAVKDATHSLLKRIGPRDGMPTATNIARVAAPTDASYLLAYEPDLAALWRTGIRAAMTTGLNGGLIIRGFEDGAYLLQ